MPPGGISRSTMIFLAFLFAGDLLLAVLIMGFFPLSVASSPAADSYFMITPTHSQNQSSLEMSAPLSAEISTPGSLGGGKVTTDLIGADKNLTAAPSSLNSNNPKKENTSSPGTIVATNSAVVAGETASVSNSVTTSVTPTTFVYIAFQSTPVVIIYPTYTPIKLRTSTPRPVVIQTNTPVVIRINTPIPTATRPKNTATVTVTTFPATPTATWTLTPTSTMTASLTATQLFTATPTALPTSTPTSTIAPTEPPVPTLTITPTLTATTSYTPTTTITPIVACSVETPVGLTPSADTWIDFSHPADPHGSDSDLLIQAAAVSMRTLVKFDTTDLAGKTVSNASLYFYISSADPGTTVFVHALAKAFVESQATWLEAQSTQSWITPGGDYTANPVSSFNATGDCLVSLDVTGLVQGWVGDSSSNHGLILDAVGQAGFTVNISSKENSNGRGPMLVVTTNP